MILTVILNSEKLKNFYEGRDCQNWQPLTLISKETLEYIKSTADEKTRIDRFAAYSLLFSLADAFFGIRIKKIGRDEFGKPYIEECLKEDKEVSDGNLHFSISHSGGIVAVTLSEDAECGVDLQIMPSKDVSERLEKRLLSSFDVRDVSVIDSDMTLKNACRVYFAEPMEKGFSLYPAFGIECKLLNDIQGLESNFGNSLETSFSIKSEKDILNSMTIDVEDIPENYPASDCENATVSIKNYPITDCEEIPKNNFLGAFLKEYKDSQELVFLKKWTLCEAILKCFGKGFRDHIKLDFLKSECNLRYYLVLIENQKFGFALAIKKEKSREM